MAGQDYVPLFLPGCEPTVTAAAAITGGQLVVFSGDFTVTPTTAATASKVGVASNTVPSGGSLAVYLKGIHLLAAAAAVAAGVPVKATAAGGVAAWVAGTDDASLIIGHSVAAAAGNKVAVHLP